MLGSGVLAPLGLEDGVGPGGDHDILKPGGFRGECPNTQLKEVKKGTGDRRAWMSGTIAVLLKPEAVIGPYENS